MKKLLLILLCLPIIGFGHNVNIPDVNFKAYLVGISMINTNGDTEIQVSEATAFNGAINCNSLNIFDLTGIEAFTALTSLDCNSNQLTSLDVSNNTALTILRCSFNQLTSLDVSNCVFLEQIYAMYNQITIFNISQNSFLYHFTFSNNPVYCLNLANGNNLNFIDCNVFMTPFLYCIEVDDSLYVPGVNTTDPQTYFSNNCNNSCSTTEIFEIHHTKKILKVKDILGRETTGTKNQPIFYIYDDGTVEKRIVIE